MADHGASNVIVLGAGRGMAAGPAAAAAALQRVHGYLDRCALAGHTVRAYRRQTAAYVAWLVDHRHGLADRAHPAPSARGRATARPGHRTRRRH